MGCDIHLYVETREGDVWVCADNLVNRYGEDWLSADDPFYHTRNYGMFAILADVRNSWGINPIADQRGVPDDLSDGLRPLFAQWELDAHSYTWLTFSDLLNFDWTQEITTGGYAGTPYHEIAGREWLATMMRLSRLNKSPDDIRIVFFFDN